MWCVRVCDVAKPCVCGVSCVCVLCGVCGGGVYAVFVCVCGGGVHAVCGVCWEGVSRRMMCASCVCVVCCVCLSVVCMCGGGVTPCVCV